MAEKNKPIHMHEHPAYEWIALVLCITIILGTAGWYYLVYSQGLNDDFVESMKSLSTPKKETTVSSTTTILDIMAETKAIDADIVSVLDSDLSDAQLDNTIIGVQ